MRGLAWNSDSRRLGSLRPAKWWLAFVPAFAQQSVFPVQCILEQQSPTEKMPRRDQPVTPGKHVDQVTSLHCISSVGGSSLATAQKQLFIKQGGIHLECLMNEETYMRISIYALLYMFLFRHRVFSVDLALLMYSSLEKNNPVDSCWFPSKILFWFLLISL